MSTQGIFLTRRNRDARTPEDFPEVTENPFPPFLLTGFWQCDYFASYTVLDQTPVLGVTQDPPQLGKTPVCTWLLLPQSMPKTLCWKPDKSQAE